MSGGPGQQPFAARFVIISRTMHVLPSRVRRFVLDTMRTIGDTYPKMSPTYSRLFALEVDGRPIIAFEASRINEARQICKESWLLDDLAVLKSGGAPLRAAKSKLSVRPATSEEITVFEQAAPEPSDEMVLVFLVELDGGAR